MSMGYVYLISIIEWFSRYLLSWRLSNSLEIDFCLSALDASLSNYHNPEIFNTDQGSQFTSNNWLKQLETSQIKISMDGKGRAIDNYIKYYNKERPHQSLDYKTPFEVYHS